jgi:hypothetical protein
MAWSYRNDRADEVYTTAGGPAAVQGEQITRPPGDGEGEVPEVDPQDEKARKEREKELRETVAKLPAISGVTAADLIEVEKQLQDPEAGRPVETPAARLARESKLVNQTQDLEATRQAGVERSRIRAEERTRLEQEEKDKDLEKVRKEEAENAKKDIADKKKADEEKRKEDEKEAAEVRKGAEPPKAATHSTQQAKK